MILILSFKNVCCWRVKEQKIASFKVDRRVFCTCWWCFSSWVAVCILITLVRLFRFIFGPGFACFYFFDQQSLSAMSLVACLPGKNSINNTVRLYHKSIANSSTTAWIRIPKLSQLLFMFLHFTSLHFKALDEHHRMRQPTTSARTALDCKRQVNFKLSKREWDLRQSAANRCHHRLIIIPPLLRIHLVKDWADRSQHVQSPNSWDSRPPYRKLA